MASSNLSYVKDLTPAKDFWNIKARIIRLWKQSYRWDLILLDEMGGKIQASVKSHLLNDFEAYLKEDAILVIRKFGVGDQRDKYRVIDLPFKINFFKCTSVCEVTGFEGNIYGFNFFPFKRILVNDVDGALTVDVLGRMAWCGDLDIYRSGGKEHKRINFDLQDAEGTVLRCTFWASYAEHLTSFISTHTSSDMVIVAIQHGRVKPFQGFTVQNDMFATRVFINEEFPEALDLRRSLILRDGASTSTTVLSSQTVYLLRNEFLLQTPRKSLQELMEIETETTCVVLGCINMFEEGAGWFYHACRRCGKKACEKKEFLEQASEIPENFIDAPVDSLWCVRCNILATNLIPKFKIQFRIIDATTCRSFVMFDSDVSKLLSVSANDIRERQIASGKTQEYPHELDVLKEKVMAFKVHVSKYNLDNKYPIYTVRKVCDDPDVIQELQNNEPHEPEPDNLAMPLEDSLEPLLSAKDSASYTDDSLAIELFKDSATSPMPKKKSTEADEISMEDQGSSTRNVKKKLLP